MVTFMTPCFVIHKFKDPLSVLVVLFSNKCFCLEHRGHIEIDSLS